MYFTKREREKGGGKRENIREGTGFENTFDSYYDTFVWWPATKVDETHKKKKRKRKKKKYVRYEKERKMLRRANFCGSITALLAITEISRDNILHSPSRRPLSRDRESSLLTLHPPLVLLSLSPLASEQRNGAACPACSIYTRSFLIANKTGGAKRRTARDCRINWLCEDVHGLLSFLRVNLNVPSFLPSFLSFLIVNDDARISFFLTTLFLLYRDNIQRNSSIFLIELYRSQGGDRGTRC